MIFQDCRSAADLKTTSDDRLEDDLETDLRETISKAKKCLTRSQSSFPRRSSPLDDCEVDGKIIGQTSHRTANDTEA